MKPKKVIRGVVDESTVISSISGELHKLSRLLGYLHMLKEYDKPYLFDNKNIIERDIYATKLEIKQVLDNIEHLLRMLKLLIKEGEVTEK